MPSQALSEFGGEGNNDHPREAVKGACERLDIMMPKVKAS